VEVGVDWDSVVGTGATIGVDGVPHEERMKARRRMRLR
jgi:hypothetical protein